MATVIGTNAADVIDWNDGVSYGADLILGFDGADTIFGLGGNDEIKGGGGADRIDGGLGVDWANYRDSTAGVTIDLSTGIGIGGTAEGDRLFNIENVGGSIHADMLVGDDQANVLSGADGDDNLKGGGGADTLIGGTGNDRLKGGGGADFIDGGEGIDTATYIDSDAGVNVTLDADGHGGTAQGDRLIGVENLEGSNYNDTLLGNASSNVLIGGRGNDKLKGGGGADTLIGGLGDDRYTVSDANAIVVEAAGEGVDTINTSVNFTLPAHVENLFAVFDATTPLSLNLTGNELANDIRGNDAANVLNGGAGADTMRGWDGDDIYVVDSINDVTIELAGDGNDTVYAQVNGYTLMAEVEVLSLNTGTALSGFGNELANDIYGNALDNVLDGRDGADQLNGLGGNDTFAFRAGEAQGDVVYDFQGNGAGVGDLLKFEGFGTLAQGASLTALGGSQYRIVSADGTVEETITVFGSVDIAQDVVLV